LNCEKEVELESSFKEHKREEIRVREVQKGFLKQLQRGVDRKSVKHFGTWSPRSDGTFVPVSFAC